MSLKFLIFCLCVVHSSKVIDEKEILPQKYRVRIPSSFMRKFLLYMQDVSNGRKQYVEYGVCSYYHDRFHKKKTATGDRFDQRIWTGAHQELPIPSIVLVCYINEKKKLNGMVILLNDRGPYAKQRILDLSYSAAKSLGIIKCGHKKIAIFFLRNETLKLHKNSRQGKEYTTHYLGVLNQQQIIELLNKNDISLQ